MRDLVGLLVLVVLLAACASAPPIGPTALAYGDVKAIINDQIQLIQRYCTAGVILRTDCDAREAAYPALKDADGQVRDWITKNGSQANVDWSVLVKLTGAAIKVVGGLYGIPIPTGALSARAGPDKVYHFDPL
jgi:hypothetical protein